MYGDAAPAPESVVFARVSSVGGTANINTRNPTTPNTSYAITRPYAMGTYAPVPPNAKLPYTLSVNAADSSCAMSAAHACIYQWALRRNGGAWIFISSMSPTTHAQAANNVSILLTEGLGGLTRVRARTLFQSEGSHESAALATRKRGAFCSTAQASMAAPRAQGCL